MRPYTVPLSFTKMSSTNEPSNVVLMDIFNDLMTSVKQLETTLKTLRTSINYIKEHVDSRTTPTPVPAPASPHQTFDMETLIQALTNTANTYYKGEMRPEVVKMCVNIINNLTNTTNPLTLLKKAKKQNDVYDTIANTIAEHYAEQIEASATQKEKDRKEAIMRALTLKQLSYPLDKEYQRDAFGSAIREIMYLPANTSLQIYMNLRGVGKSIGKVIETTYNEYN